MSTDDFDAADGAKRNAADADDFDAADGAMDARLNQASARWRQQHTAAAQGDFDALGLTGQIQPTAVAASAAAPVAIAVTSVADDRRHPSRGRRLKLWLAASVGVAAAVAATILIFQFGGAGQYTRPGPLGAAGTNAPHTASGAGSTLIGTDWTLVQVTPAGKPAQRAVIGAPFRIDSAGQMVANDECNTISGPVTVTSSVLRFGDLASTAMGCLDPGFSPPRAEQTRVINAVLSAQASWSITGERLTITKAGAGTLTYQAVNHTKTTAPAALANTSWQLDSIMVNNGASSSATGSSAYQRVTLGFDGTARVSGSDGCNSFGGDVTIGSGTMRFGRVMSTLMACAVQDDSVRAVLHGSVTWSIIDDRLTISSGATSLVYDKAGQLNSPPSATVVPTGSAVPSATASAASVPPASTGSAGFPGSYAPAGPSAAVAPTPARAAN